MDFNGKTVTVTGVTGYVGKWVAYRLLEKGYAVRGTLRDAAKHQPVTETLGARLGKSVAERLSLVEADLLNPEDWPPAMEGSDALVHVATRVVGAEPRDPNDVVLPALEGTRNVLEAANAAGIDRAILTSTIATVGYGQNHTSGTRVYTEDNWTDLENMRWTWAYCIGKTRAEREAWAYAGQQGMKLTTVHPGMILGPPLDADSGVSVGLISGMLNGTARAFPNLGFALSDVRDVADMHVAALENDESIGQRFLCTSRHMPLSEIADLLRQAYPDAPITDRFVPDWLLRVLVYWNRSVRQVINDVGNEKHFDGSRGRALLGRDYRSDKETILDSAKALIELGLVKIP